MSSNPRLKIGMYASIAMISFLFVYCPALLSTAAYSTTAAPAAKRTASLLPPGQTMPTVRQQLPTTIYAKVNCAVAPYCVATDSIEYANVYITQGTKLVTTVAVCGTGYGITYVSSMKAWIISDCGMLQVISVSTYKVRNLTLANSIDGAGGIVYDAKYKMFYVAQFGYGEVAAVTTKGAITEIDLLSAPGCSDGYYPEFIDASAKTGIVYEGARYECAVAINGTEIVDSSTSVYGSVGVSVNQKNGDPYFSDGVYDELYVCTSNLSSCSVVSSFSEGLWGSFYAPYDKSVWVTNYAGDEITPVSYKNVVGTPVNTGEENDDGCASPLSKGVWLAAPEYYYSDSLFLYNMKTGKSESGPSGYYGLSCAFNSIA